MRSILNIDSSEKFIGIEIDGYMNREKLRGMVVATQLADAPKNSDEEQWSIIFVDGSMSLPNSRLGGNVYRTKKDLLEGLVENHCNADVTGLRAVLCEDAITLMQWQCDLVADPNKVVELSVEKEPDEVYMEIADGVYAQSDDGYTVFIRHQSYLYETDTTNLKHILTAAKRTFEGQDTVLCLKIGNMPDPYAIDIMARLERLGFKPAKGVETKSVPLNAKWIVVGSYTYNTFHFDYEEVPHLRPCKKIVRGLNSLYTQEIMGWAADTRIKMGKINAIEEYFGYQLHVAYKDMKLSFGCKTIAPETIDHFISDCDGLRAKKNG